MQTATMLSTRLAPTVSESVDLYSPGTPVLELQAVAVQERLLCTTTSTARVYLMFLRQQRPARGQWAAHVRARAGLARRSAARQQGRRAPAPAPLPLLGAQRRRLPSAAAAQGCGAADLLTVQQP